MKYWLIDCLLCVGLMFASVAWMEIAGTLVGAVAQNAVFAATVSWMPSFVFILGAAIYVFTAAITMYVCCFYRIVYIISGFYKLHGLLPFPYQWTLHSELKMTQNQHFIYGTDLILRPCTINVWNCIFCAELCTKNAVDWFALNAHNGCKYTCTKDEVKRRRKGGKIAVTEKNRTKLCAHLLSTDIIDTSCCGIVTIIVDNFFPSCIYCLWRQKSNNVIIIIIIIIECWLLFALYALHWQDLGQNVAHD